MDERLLSNDDFFKLFPEFEKEIADQSEQDRFQLWSDSILSQVNISGTFGLDPSNESELKHLKFLKGLYIAHIIVLAFLPKEAGGNIVGDEASSSFGQGGINFSSSRVNFKEYIVDPIYSRTRYGSLFAFHLRQSGVGLLINSDVASDGVVDYSGF